MPTDAIPVIEVILNEIDLSWFTAMGESGIVKSRLKELNLSSRL